MTESNILQFPIGASTRTGSEPADALLQKIVIALQAMQELHAELEDLKTRLKAENYGTSGE